MKRIVKKSVGVLLILLIVLSTFTGCMILGYSNGNSNLGFPERDDLNAKVKANNCLFEKDGVTLDLFYCFYCLDEETIEQSKANHHYIPSESEKDTFHSESAYAIYISKNNLLVFERDENEGLIDYENKVNARLWKFISFEEAFNTNYGYTTDQNDSALNKRINYNHNEKLTIPTEFFDSSSGCVYIHIVSFLHDVNADSYFTTSEMSTIRIKYKLLGDTVVLIND